MAARLIVVCGYPVSGKSTMAMGLSEVFKAHMIDIDALRRLTLGVPHPRPNESKELMNLDKMQMLMSYRLMLQSAAYNLQLGRTIVVAATFSRKSYRMMLTEMMKQVMLERPEAKLYVVQCVLEMESAQAEDDEVRRRLMRPVENAGAVTTPERYYEVKKRYEPFDVHEVDLRALMNGFRLVNTAPPKTSKESLVEAMQAMR